MVTDCRINRIVNHDLLSFLEDIDCSGMQLELLRLCGRHPKARLSLYTIARALDTTKINLRDTITASVEKGILIGQQDSNGLTTYALSDDQQIQGYIGELAKLDWSETINLGEHLKEEAVSPTNKRE